MTIYGLREHLTEGVWHGVFVWLVYAVVEFFFEFTAPALFDQSQRDLIPWHFLLWGVSLASFALAGAVGGLFAGAGASLLSGRLVSPSLVRSMSTVVLPLVFAVNILIRPPFWGPDYAGVAACSLICVCLLWTALSAQGAPRVRVLTGPWTVCVVVVGFPWLEATSRRQLVLPALLLLCLILLAIFADNRLLGPVGAPEARRVPSRQVLSLLSMVILIPAGTSAFFRVCPPRVLDSRPARAASDARDVVLVTLDTVRGDHTSLDGYERDTTPFLRSLAQESTVYTRAIASTNWTLPSHASMFTGLPFRAHGAGSRLDERFTTLAEVMGAAGYYTMAAVANFSWLRRDDGIAQGFQTFRTLELLSPKYYLVRAVRNVVDTVAMTDLSRRFYRAEDVNRYAFRMLDDVDAAGGHFFLFLNYMDAHTPYVPPSPYNDKYPGRNVFATASRYRTMKEEVISGRRDIAKAEKEAYISQYDGGIAYMDAQLRVLVSRLREMGRYDNTLIIITSDHGEAFGVKGYVEHSGSIRQDEVGVPLLIKYPHQTRGETVTDAVSLVDLMATVCSTIGLQTPHEAQGRSLRQMEAGQKDRKVVTEHHGNGEYCRLNKRRCMLATALIQGHWKYVAYSNGSEAMYDLTADPGETTNLFSAEDHFDRDLRLSLAAWMEAVPKYEGRPAKMDPETVDRLRSLGYIQ